MRAGGNIPQANPEILPATCECQPIRTEIDAGSITVAESFLAFAGDNIPEVNVRSISTCECQPIRTEIDAGNIAGVQSVAGFSGGKIP